MIEPDIDAYGGLAHGSALADYLELLALSGHSCARAQLLDNMQDKYLKDWKKKKHNNIVEPSDWQDDGTFDDSDEHDIQGHVDEAYECLEERIDTLADRYPFTLEVGGMLKLKTGTVPTDSTYIALLCITTAHAYGKTVKPGVNPRELFEEVVASTLESRGLLVARMGDLSRKHGMKFVPAFEEAGDILEIAVDPSAAPFKRHANDAGADVLAHLSWRDGRIGRWTLTGQVTCAKSDYWQGKMGQAQPGLWRDFYMDKVDSICFLAVPHHAPRDAYTLIVTEHGKAMLDRLRLVQLRDVVTADEVIIISAVLAAGVDNVAAA